nr:hypothetical protein [Tanacetum cinerariifolium]
MTSFDYRLNPLYPIKECSSCGALYTTDNCCSVGILGDKIIYDLDKTPNFSQRSPQNCPMCGHPVNGHYCQGCALLRKKFKEDLFTSEPFVVNQDLSKNSSQSPPQINHHCCYGYGDQLEGIFCHQCTYKFCGNGAHYGYNCPPKVPIIPDPKPFNNQTIKELPPTQYTINHHIFNVQNDLFNSQNKLMEQLTSMCDMVSQFIQKKEQEKQIEEDQAANAQNWKIPACYDDDDDTITPNEPVNSVSMGDEHLDTIPTTKSDEFIKSSIENLVPNPSESEGENKCDMTVCEAFTTFSNILFDAEYDFYSSDDQSFSDEDFLKEIYSNPLFDEEIIPMKIDPHHFNSESDLIESMLKHDSSIISSLKIDSLFDEFAGELTLLKSIPPGIVETDCDPEEETHFIKRLLYDNSSPRPPKEFVFENSYAEIESFSPSPIPVEDNDSLMEEINLSFTLDYPEKSSDLLSHQGHETFQPSAECP